jgi:hypothetical protein
MMCSICRRRAIAEQKNIFVELVPVCKISHRPKQWKRKLNQSAKDLINSQIIS